MSAEKKYTERDLVLAKREGYVDCRVTHGYRDVHSREVYGEEARKRYPLPKVTRPRVVQDELGDSGHPVWFRVSAGGGIEYQLSSCGGQWYTIGRLLNVSSAWPRDDVSATQQMTRWEGIWADLRVNPTEEVEDA